MLELCAWGLSPPGAFFLRQGLPGLRIFEEPAFRRRRSPGRHASLHGLFRSCCHFERIHPSTADTAHLEGQHGVSEITFDATDLMPLDTTSGFTLRFIG